MTRTNQQIKQDYEIEKELANKLRNSSKEERYTLYTSVYNEFFEKVPHEPQLSTKRIASVRNQMRLIMPLLGQESTFAEIGAGDCTLSIEISKHVKQVYAIEVSNEISKDIKSPLNFKLIISNGTNIPIPKNSVNMVYSYQVMEHIHPEDALEQLQNIYETLTHNGTYICITPNKIYGPNDISRHFDQEATCFHLKEYTIFELKELFENVGFSNIKLCVGGKGNYFLLPTWPFILIEKFLLKIPSKLRTKIARTSLLTPLLHVRLIGIKR